MAGQKVTVFIPVICECDEPIANADVRVRVYRRDSGPPDGTLYGKTTSGGFYLDSYQRKSTDLSDIVRFEVEIIACDSVVSYESKNIKTQLSVSGVVNLFTTVYGTFLAGGTDPDTDIKGLLEKTDTLAGLSTDQLFEWVLVPTLAEAKVSECHDDCDDAKAVHSTGTLGLGDDAVNVAFGSTEVGGMLGMGGSRRFTYEITNRGDDPVTDLKMCFDGASAKQVQAVLAEAPTVPAGWTARRDGSCLIFETDDVDEGIASGEKGSFAINVSKSAKAGRIKLNASTLDGNEHTDLFDPEEVPGPALALVEFPESPELETAFVLDRQRIQDASGTILQEPSSELDKPALEEFPRSLIDGPRPAVQGEIPEPLQVDPTPLEGKTKLVNPERIEPIDTSAVRRVTGDD